MVTYVRAEVDPSPAELSDENAAPQVQPPSAPEAVGLASQAWIPDPWKLWDHQRLLFQAAQFMVVCYAAKDS